MKLSEYGKLVRKARIDAGVTMLDMARSIGVAPSYLSATEVGSKKVSPSFIEKVVSFFASKGIKVEGLHEAADVSNQSVSLAGLSDPQKFLIAGFARMNFSDKQVDEIRDFLVRLDKEAK